MHKGLHVYSQDGPHDPVIVVGTQEGLLTVMLAILEALVPGTRHPRLVFAADGEGYEVDARLVTEDELGRYVSPYRADWAHDPAEDESPRWPLKGA